ncbi:dimeric xylose reductase in complex with Nadp(H) [Scheffersomyces xylosifermentans]
MVAPIPQIKLSSGHLMPSIGFGCWKLDKPTAGEQVYEAIKAGYRLFDGAEDYGNEKEIGDGVKKAIDEGIVKREELFLVSKLWNNYHDPKNVETALDRTLADLKTDYVDLFYIHFPIAFKFVPLEEKYPPAFYCGDGDNFHYEDVPILETWKALEKLVASGKIRSIGVSNFPGALLLDLLRGATIKPAVLQVEHHPYLQQPRLIEFAQKAGLTVTAYSSFGPQSFVEMNQGRALKTPPLFENEVIKAIAAKHNRAPAEVLLRWSAQRGIAVIPKSNLPERLVQNRGFNSFDLTKEDFEEIAKLDINLRFNDPWDWDHIPIFV